MTKEEAAKRSSRGEPFSELLRRACADWDMPVGMFDQMLLEEGAPESETSVGRKKPYASKAKKPIGNHGSQ